MSVARFVVATFRTDAARAGASGEITQLVDELCRTSDLFARLWESNDVTGHGDGLKRLRHPELGLIELEFSTFAVEGRPDLTMMVYNPTSEAVSATIATLIEGRRAAS